MGRVPPRRPGRGGQPSWPGLQDHRPRKDGPRTIGSLDQLIHEAANEAISDGTEKITRKHLDAVVLDTAAEEQYRPPAPPPACHGRREEGQLIMRLWHAPARALPVTVRPVGGETVVSYVRRLSAANDLPPTTILRALGQLT